MRKSLLMIIIVVFVAIGVPTARADASTESNINFQVTTGDVFDAPTGSFIFDNTTNLFTTFEVAWDGIGFDLAACANGKGEPGGTNECGFSSKPDGLTSYLALISCDGGTTDSCGWDANIVTFAADAFFDMFNRPWQIQGLSLGVGFREGNAAGTFTVPTFDPGTGPLILIGVGLLGLMMRKRPAANG